MSGPAGKEARARAEADTLPPPPPKASRRPRHDGASTKTSYVRHRKKDPEGPVAHVDEVTADLTKDPRREKD